MGLKNWFRRRPSDDEMREELEAHVAMRAEHDRVDEAAARRRLGNMLQTREAVRRVWIAAWWDELRQDTWFTWRSWRRKPGFALGAVLVLALGLGASTALFAALDRVLFRPLPYADPDRLVSVGLVTAPPGGTFPDQPEMVLDQAYVQVWADTPAPFESMTVMDTATCSIAEAQPEGIRCGVVDHDFLGALGVRVVVGRDFTPEDDVRGAPPVALISHGLWVRRYGADPSVVGRLLRIESSSAAAEELRVIGVLPADFDMPVEAAEVLSPMWRRPPRGLLVMAFARMKPGVTPERAASMLAPSCR